ncbi:MAG TPA: GntR family transcriptional regulator [Candidatus Prevotella stercoripullorum]|nr:GntR family transcriptional regulator [Candidatus Prevotella stercoripullorum]
MDFIRLGDYNRMTVVKTVDFGVYLDGGEEGEVLLPARYVPDGCKEGDELEVFVYLDNEERLVATTQTPLAKVGDFTCLEVSWVNEYGAFLNWGLMKDLFCPFREQKMKMEKGKSYIVHVHIDNESHRIVASAKVERYFAPSFPPYRYGDEVGLLVWQKTDLGFKVIVDNRYAGLVYSNQIFRDIHTGDRMKGYIEAVREDGKIDVMLQPTGWRMTKETADVLLDYLETHQGVCRLTDKSPAEDIYQAFQVSKKSYKKAVGDLYKRRLITIEEDCIRLNKGDKRR